ncbi:PadR family transcriptional regulator [Microbispora sp. NPDC049125]|uniref:PadR family transcriptional regulator n=1 Tax=Microbispora sp. NPDC049125 TaxID=3154929 RepID=UPI0034671032
MAEIRRITQPTLDVIEALVDAHRRGEELHGWAIIKAVGRTGPTVYNVLDRLEDAKWISGRWESENPDPSRPRRRFYSLTGEGARRAPALLAERRPGAVSARLAGGHAFDRLFGRHVAGEAR